MRLASIVADNIRVLRARRRYSQQQLAEKVGVSVSYISMLERGQRKPPLGTLGLLAEALGVPAVSLLGRH